MDGCRECGAGLVRQRVWRKLTQAERDRLTAEGKRRQERPGLCSRCFHRANREKQRAEADIMTRDLVLTDWRWLHETGQLSETEPLAARVRVAAPRMGMTVDALAKALERAGVRNPVEPSLDMHHRVSECRECNVRQRAVDLAERDLWHVARMLAKMPDSRKLRLRLENARDELARVKVRQEWHLDAEHPSAAA